VKTSITDRPTVDFEHLTAQLAAAPSKDIYRTIVEAPFQNKLAMAFLFVGFICAYEVDEAKSEVQLMAASGTAEYELAIEHYKFKPSNFHLSLDTDTDNTIVQAVTSGHPQGTSDWLTLSRKRKSAQAVRFNQANSGIAYTAIYPFQATRRGALMFNFYQYADEISKEQRDFMERYTALVSTFLENRAA
jgi:hypothetical protein